MSFSVRSILPLTYVAAACFAAGLAQNNDGKPKVEMYRVQAGQPDKEGWCQAESTRRHFKVRLPGPFNDFRVPGDASEAVTDTSVLGMMTQDKSKWSATLASYEDPSVAKKYFDSFEKGFNRGKLLNAKTFQYRGQPAKEIWIESGARSAAMREVLVGREAYLLIVEYDTARTKDLKLNILLFLNSLEFSPTAPES